MSLNVSVSPFSAGVRNTPELTLLREFQSPVFFYKAMCVHALMCMHARMHVGLRKQTYVCMYIQWPEVSLRCHYSGMIHFVFEFCFLFCFVLRQSLTSLELTNLTRLASQGVQEIIPVSACVTPT